MTGQPLSDGDALDEWNEEELKADYWTGGPLQPLSEERMTAYLLAMPAWSDVNGTDVLSWIDRLHAEMEWRTGERDQARAEVARLEAERDHWREEACNSRSAVERVEILIRELERARDAERRRAIYAETRLMRALRGEGQ